MTDNETSDTKRVPPINLTYEGLDYVMALAFRGEPPNDAQLETDPNYELYHSAQDKFETADTRANRYSGTDTKRVPPINLTYSELQYVMALAFRGEPPNDAQLESDPNYELYRSVEDKFESAKYHAERS